MVKFRQITKIQSVQQGFTLIEIMVVVAIISILAVAIVPNVISNIDKANVSKAQSDIRAIEGALDMFRLENGKYPSTDQGLQALTQPSKAGGEGQLRKLSKDPWGNEYQYLSPGEHSRVDIYSLGADGAIGGEGYDADIGNWNL